MNSAQKTKARPINTPKTMKASVEYDSAGHHALKAFMSHRSSWIELVSEYVSGAKRFVEFRIRATNKVLRELDRWLRTLKRREATPRTLTA